MAQQQFEYKGHTVVVDEEHGHATLQIDGKMLHVHVYHRPNGEHRYQVMIACYSEYATVADVARGVIDVGALAYLVES